MTFVVFLCVWTGQACEPIKEVGQNIDAMEACMIYTAQSPHADGCVVLPLNWEKK